MVLDYCYNPYGVIAMSDSTTSDPNKPKEGFDVELSAEKYEKEDYNDYPTPTGSDKTLLIGVLVGVAIIFLFIILAVGF